MTYPNVTNITSFNITSVPDLFQMTNTLSGGFFGIVISFVVYGLLFVGVSSRMGFKDAIISASFVTGLLNVFLVNLGMLSGLVAALPIIVLAMSMFLPRT